MPGLWLVVPVLGVPRVVGAPRVVGGPSVVGGSEPFEVPDAFGLVDVVPGVFGDCPQAIPVARVPKKAKRKTGKRMMANLFFIQIDPPGK